MDRLTQAGIGRLPAERPTVRRAIKRSFGPVAILTSLLALAGPAGAASAPQSGWWTSLPAPLAPDAPADGLVVQGGPDASQPVSYAAVSYELGDGESATTLKLAVAPSSGSNSSASVIACPLTSGFSPAQGGASSSGPSFDCAIKAAAKIDGSTFIFDVGPLVRDRVLAVAIVATTASDRVVFSHPGADALTTTAAAPADASSADSSAFADSSAAATDQPVTSALPAFDVPAAPAPDVPDVPTGAASTTTVALTPRTLTAQPVAASSGGRSLRPFVFGALALGAAACWLLAGRREPSADDPAWEI